LKVLRCLDLPPPIHDTILRCDPLFVSSRQHEFWTMKGLIIGLDFSVLIFMLLKPSYCIQAVRNICAPEPHFVPDIVRTKLTREFTFIPVLFPDVVYRNAFGPESSQKISGGKRE
jgi:hypothetical protein